MKYPTELNATLLVKQVFHLAKGTHLDHTILPNGKYPVNVTKTTEIDNGFTCEETQFMALKLNWFLIILFSDILDQNGDYYFSDSPFWTPIFQEAFVQDGYSMCIRSYGSFPICGANNSTVMFFGRSDKTKDWFSSSFHPINGSIIRTANIIG